MAGNALALMAIQSVVNIRKQEALQLLAAGYGCTELVSQLAENWGAHGCNIAVRMGLATGLRLI
jgi:hypothetical protein